MVKTLYQYCDKCKEERNFSWIDSFRMECNTCGYTTTAKVKEVVQFSSMKIEGTNNHLDFKEAEKLFEHITKQDKPKVDPLEGIDVPMDVSGGVYGQKLKQGREIKHTPIEIRDKDFPTSVNLEIFLKGGEDE